MRNGRTSPTDSGKLLPLLKLLVFTLAVPCSVTVWVPFFLLSNRMERTPGPFGARVEAGIALILAGALGYLWCALDFAFRGRGTPAPVDPPKILVRQGLYRFVRNPMYLSVLLVLTGESVVYRSRFLLRYSLVVWVLFFLIVLLYEEPMLRGKFGDSYREYSKEVPRWIPRIPRRGPGHAL